MTINDINVEIWKHLKSSFLDSQGKSGASLADYLLALAQEWRIHHPKASSRSVCKEVEDMAMAFDKHCKYVDVPSGYQTEQVLDTDFATWIADDQPLGSKLFWYANEWRRLKLYVDSGTYAGHVTLAGYIIYNAEREALQNKKRKKVSK